MFPSPLLTLEVSNPVCDRLGYNQKGGKLLLGITGPVSNRLSASSVLYTFPLPTASHLRWFLTFLFLSHAAFLFLTGVWISRLEQDRVLGRFLLFSECGMLLLITLLWRVILFTVTFCHLFFVPNQFYLPLL